MSLPITDELGFDIRMLRRDFLRLGLKATTSGLLFSSSFQGAFGTEYPKEMHFDVVIVGGGFGACAAALAALRQGLRVVMTEPTDWIGGQTTSQAVPPDEHPWIESFGCTRSYRAYRNKVREFYRTHYPLTAEATANPHLNPGNGWVSRLCHEPRVSLAVLQQMLMPFLASGRFTLLLNSLPVGADVNGDRVVSVSIHHQDINHRMVLHAPYYIDATELGDLLPLTKTEYITGAESKSDHQEPHAPDKPDPNNEQAVTACFAMDYLHDQDHTIDKPRDYDFWRDYVPKLNPSWTGKLFSWECSDPVTLRARSLAFDPTEKTRARNLWTYRRILDPSQLVPNTIPSGICLVNWPQNDYWLHHFADLSKEEFQLHSNRAKQLSLSLLYWMQTQAPRPDGGTGWKGLRLRPDVVGTKDGLAKFVYVRESRRIKAEFTIIEQHISTELRMAETKKPREETVATPFPDSIGIGCYRVDLHPSSGGNNYIDFSSLPFQIPLGALLPRRIENLIAGNKNIGSTHITNGAFRLHPVEWNIGEAAGALVAFCLKSKKTPKQVRNSQETLESFQAALRTQGFELEWPKLRPV